MGTATVVSFVNTPANDSLIRWTIPSLASQASATLVIEALYDMRNFPDDTDITNRARLFAVDQFGPQEMNDTASVNSFISTSNGGSPRLDRQGVLNRIEYDSTMVEITGVELVGLVGRELAGEGWTTIHGAPISRRAEAR